MLHITHHQGNTDQNHNERPPHTCQNGSHEQLRQQQMLARMRRKRISFALLVAMQAGAATLENTVEVPQKIENGTTYNSAIALLGIYLRDTGVLFQRDTCTPMFIATVLTIVKVWKEPKCP